MSKIFYIAMLSVFLVSCKPEASAVCAELDNQNVNKIYIAKKDADCGFSEFNIEVALTQAQQMKGLMNRQSLPEDSGMLFMFNDEAERGFWMKNTLIPLDIIFIKRDGTIHHIHSNAKPHDLTRILSNGPAMAVLEINGGLSQKMDIKVGDIVTHPFFNAVK